MDIHELQWLRTYSGKLDPELRSLLITHYRKITKAPCFLKRIYNFIQNSWRHFPVIVQLTPTRDFKAIQKLRSTLTKYNKSITDLTIINSFATSLSHQALKELAAHPLIARIYVDQEIRTLLNIANPTIKTPSLWAKNYTGKNVTIAILDTGIAPHPDLLLPESRVIAFKDFVNKQDSALYDDNGHGTHCAGSAAGNGYNSAGKFKGPAFEAKLVIIKILDKKGVGQSSVAIKAIEWLLTQRKIYNIKIISLSLGYRTSLSYRADPFCQALEKAWEKGIVICTAAGNDGPEPKTINSPGIHPQFITIGAYDDHNTIDRRDDTIADYSSRGTTLDGHPKPDLLLPGTNIISTRAKGSYLDKLAENEIFDNWYVSFSGTSMAPPICAGIIAQLLEAKPYLSPPQIKELLQQSCVPNSSADINAQGSGFLDCDKLLQQTETS